MLYKVRFYLFLCVLCTHISSGQMVPSDPVLNFRLPQFAKNGYTKWILEGGKGIYDSAEQIRVEDMSLRVYSADERMALEMKMESPQATLLIKENKAVSDEPIEIVGTNFKVSGVGWAWDGETKEIEVKFDAVVEFTQGISGMLADKPALGTEEGEWTEISSKRMLLRTTPEAYCFEFIDSVQVNSGDTYLKSELLTAFADTPEGEQSSGMSTMTDIKVDSISQITASDQVVISQGSHTLYTERAEFTVREERAEFYGNPRIETPGVHLNGAMMRSERGLVLITGSQESGRAKMVVSQTGGLGISTEIPLAEETIIFADRIEMKEFESETRFTFNGSVEVGSGAMEMNADRLTLFTDPTIEATDDESDEGFNVGEVVRIVAEGSVKIKGENQQAVSDKAVFYPKEEQAELSGNPQVVHDEVTITGESMSLKPGSAIVRGSERQLAKVVLPEMQDLGYTNVSLIGASSPIPEDKSSGENETVIKAQTIEMIEKADHNLFKFVENVSVIGNNLNSRCKRMDVVVAEQLDAAVGKKLPKVQTVHAYEDVVFEQSGRKATADMVSIMPGEGKIVLEGNPVVTDDQGKVTGHRITLLQGERRAIVEGDESKGTRARITLPETDFLDVEL